MNNLNSSKKNILQLLFKSYYNLDSFTLFKRSKLSFSLYSLIIRQLLSDGFITEEDNNIVLTNKAKTFIITTRSESGKSNSWREIPAIYKTNEVSIDEPYVPSIRRLDKRTFKIPVT
jgi:hypothetical protein